jgi:hypothetical protein
MTTTQLFDPGPLDPREAFDQWMRRYRRGEHWQQFRGLVILRRGDHCERCGAPAPLDIHHEHYNTLCREDVADVRVLCKRCHLEGHGR